MHTAQTQYKISVIKLLVEHGADVNAKDSEGYTALSHSKRKRSKRPYYGPNSPVQGLTGIEVKATDGRYVYKKTYGTKVENENEPSPLEMFRKYLEDISDE